MPCRLFLLRFTVFSRIKFKFFMLFMLLYLSMAPFPQPGMIVLPVTHAFSKTSNREKVFFTFFKDKSH